MVQVVKFFCRNVSTAFGRAMHLAREITNHPQECLRADRASVYYSMFVSKSFQDSLQFENQNGLPVLTKVYSSLILPPSILIYARRLHIY